MKKNIQGAEIDRQKETQNNRITKRKKEEEKDKETEKQ